jgi:hypothetical protein
VAGVLFEQAAMRLWAGQRPEPLRALWEMAGRVPLWTGVQLRTWTALARVCPGALRAGMRARARVRDRLAGLWLDDRRAERWCPG